MTLKLINNLQKFGFTENEAKIYASLVCLKTASAREIYETSGVPRPKVYKILRGMAEKGYVRIIEGEPTHFICLRPEKLISRIRADFMLSLNEIFYGLNALSREKEVPDFGKSVEIGLRC